MAEATDEFSTWLSKKLQALNTDEGVFTTYITGILDSDESDEDKIRETEELLTEISLTDISNVCKEIVDMWNKFHPKGGNLRAVACEDVDAKLLRLLESQSLNTTTQRVRTDEERKIKEQILAQYSQMDEEDEERDGVDGKTTKHYHEVPESGDSLARNTNALCVQQAEKEKREMAKVESQKKKDKDKEDREKQRQMKDDKKEKRKTQKGERRR